MKNPKCTHPDGPLHYPPFQSKKELVKALADVENHQKSMRDVVLRLDSSDPSGWPDAHYVSGR